MSSATPLSAVNELMVDVPGGTVSTVTTKADDASLTLPDESAFVAVNLWAPFPNAEVINQTPLFDEDEAITGGEQSKISAITGLQFIGAIKFVVIPSLVTTL